MTPPRHRFRAWAGAVLIGAALALAAGGCEQPGTQAPLPAAKKLDESTSAIASSCGYAMQLTAFGGPHAKGLGTLEKSADAGVRKLLTVWHHSRTWIYQGETINGIVADSISLLGNCGLGGAQKHLLRGISTHHHH